MKLSVIIVNYRSPELVLQCLQTVYAETKLTAFEVIVVDNDSQDNSRELVMQEFPDIIWIAMPENTGFARANNAGIRASKGEWVLLLNSDTLILDQALDRVMRDVQEQADVSAASVQLLHADHRVQSSGNYFVRGGINILLTLPYINSLVRSIGKLTGWRKPSITSASASGFHDVDWISGAFMLVRRNVLDRAGLLDEEFFLFSEEIEWCSRLKQAGKIRVYTDIQVVHLEGGTMKKMQQKATEDYFPYWTPKGRQLMLSHLLRIRKQYGVLWLLINLLFFVAEIPVLWLAVLFTSRISYYDALGYMQNVAAVFPYLQSMILRKPCFYKVMS